MKRILTVLMMLGLVVTAGVAYTAETADISVTIRISQLSVAVNPTSYDFGTMVAGAVDVADTFIAVTNDGNVTEKYQLSMPSGEPNGTWTSVTAGAPGAEEYRLSAIFKDSQPISGNFLAEDSFSVSTSRVATATDLALDADPDGEKGFNIAATAGRKMWFKLEAPSATVITTQQTITVRVTAQAN